MRNGSLEAVSEDVFARTPSALLELFVLLQQNPEINGVRASTMRAVARSLWLIDEEFRQNPRHHRLFLEILRAPRRRDARAAAHEHLRGAGALHPGLRPHRRAHAVRPVPRLHGRCAHAVRGEQPAPLRDPALRPRAAGGLARSCSSCRSREIAYLAALFHDIAKGRGGDHSELGAVDAEAFCLEQGLSRYDARLVAWLVRNHLQLSITAQKQDIGDPQVINAFARQVGDETHLDYLYVLTCADVRGTNPKLWNSWKASLFHDFYERVKRALRRGLESPIDQEQLVRETQDAARRAAARARRRRRRTIERTWTRFSPSVLPAAHARGDRLAHARCWPSATRRSDEPLVALEPQQRPRHHRGADLRAARGATALRAPPRCSISSASISSMRASRRPAMASASICTTCSRTTARRSPMPTGSSEIEQALWRSLQRPGRCAVRRLAARAAPGAHVQHRRPRSAISVDERNRRSVLELIAGDRPGLLCEVGKVLMAASASSCTPPRS